MAVNEGRILITNDKELAKIAMSRKIRGIVLLRLRDERSVNKISSLKKVIELHRDKLETRLVVVTEKKIRIRTLV